MKSCFFIFFALLYVCSANARKQRNQKSYVEKYVYNVQYFNMHIGDIYIDIIWKKNKKQTFQMKLKTKPSLSWVYKLNQSIFVNLSDNFSQIVEWKNIKLEKKKKTYEHIKVKLIKTKSNQGQIELRSFTKALVLKNTKKFFTSPPAPLHSVWTLPWYGALSKWQNKTISLLYGEKIISAKINFLRNIKEIVLGRKRTLQMFSIYSSAEKRMGLKILLTQGKGKVVVSGFYLKLKMGELKAKIKSYNKVSLR